MGADRMSPNLQVDLRNTRVIVTGAAGGIGRRIADVFAHNGATLFLLDQDERVEDVVTSVMAAHSVKAYAMVADLMEEGIAYEVARHSLSVMGGCDVLINNAATGYVVDLVAMTAEQWQRTMMVNVQCPFLLAQAIANECMIPAGYGRIINMASQAGIVAIEGQSAYCASKAAVMSLTRSMAVEWGRYGINANCIAPTVVETEAALKSWAGEAGEKHRRAIPVGRFAKPEEVADVCLFLASSAAAMISGATVMMDGGFTIQ